MTKLNWFGKIQVNNSSLKRPVGQVVTRSTLDRKIREVQIPGRLNRILCCQRLATTATFLRKEEYCPDAMTRRWDPHIATRVERVLDIVVIALYWSRHSCKSGRAFRVEFGPKVDKILGLDSGLRRTFCLRCTKI